MEVIVLRASRPVTLGARHVALFALAFLLAVVMASSLLYYLMLHYGRDLGLPMAPPSVQAPDRDVQQRYLKQNLAAMANKLGELQARLMRLDVLAERVQSLTGVKTDAPKARDPSAADTKASAPSAEGRQSGGISMTGIAQELDAFAARLEQRGDDLSIAEAALTNDKVLATLLPTYRPVSTGYRASDFGWRTDPFTGHQAFHKGVDFAAASGTPIVAAAGGVVIAAGFHPEYGNMIEIDHGNDTITRYGHASKLLVKIGDIVRRGQHIANVGSTGRSTGPHLHFEVLVHGERQNPHKFLAAGGADLQPNAHSG